MVTTEESGVRRLVKRRSVRSALWLAYLVVLGGLAEYGTRMLDVVPAYTPQPELAIKLFYEDPNGLVLLRPNARYYTNGNVPMVVNSDGYRDRLYSRSKDPSVTRIAVVGDSFTMGDGVLVEDSYPKQLERLLATEGRHVEVINFGITSTNTFQQLAFVRERVLGYHPDVIVLGFNLNDYRIFQLTDFARADDSGIKLRVNADRTVTVFPSERTAWERVTTELTNRSALVRLARAAQQGLVAKPRRAPGPPRDLTSSLIQIREIPAQNYARINQAVLDMRELVQSQGARFAVLFIPAMTELPRPYMQMFDEYPYGDLHHRIGAFFMANGISCLDTLPYFRGQRLRGLIVSQFDPHFNRRGNAVIAGALQGFLMEEHLVE